MALSIGERCCEECIHDIHGNIFADHTRTDRENIRVVVLTGQPGGSRIVAETAADAADLVCSNGNTDTGRADDNALFAFAAGNCLRDSTAEFGIVTGIKTVSTEIFALHPLLFQMRDHLCLEFKSAMIRSDCNHLLLLRYFPLFFSFSFYSKTVRLYVHDPFSKQEQTIILTWSCQPLRELLPSDMVRPYLIMGLTFL